MADREAEERLSLLEGNSRKIENTETRSSVLGLYAKMITAMEIAVRGAYSDQEKRDLVRLAVMSSRQEISEVMGKTEMENLFGTDEETEIIFSMAQETQ